MSAALFGVDVGGTFTDVVLVKDGAIRVTKVPSVPADPQLAVIEGARRLGVDGAVQFNHASTKGLNAVLTRTLPKVGFLTTEGHRDILDAGRSWRPLEGQMNPHWRRSFGDASRPLVPRYLRRGVTERMLASGEPLIALDEEQARGELALLRKCGVAGVAICLLNAYVNPAHEARLAQIAREELGPEVAISVSHRVGPKAKEYARASTTVVDVLMKLIYGDYAGKLHEGLGALGFAGQLNFADSTASLQPWRQALDNPHRILFAGPAAGAASMARLGQAIGDDRLIGCDVGGTSTDVSIIVGGQPFTNDSFEIEFDLVVNALATEVSSVGAGGGSIVAVTQSGDIAVGPKSAGAIPGPACYQRGGTLPTVTDACLLMGILDPAGFADGQLELNCAASERAFDSLDTPLSQGERVAFAWRVALNNIAEEVVNAAIRHGADPRDFSLVAFGSAGPMLLAGALDLTQVRRIIVPPHPGLFSAIGLVSTDLVFVASKSAYLMLGPDQAPRIDALLAELEAEVRGQGDAATPGATIRRTVDARILGQSWETPFIDIPDGTVDAAALATLAERFHAEYARRNGQSFAGMPVQGVTWRVQLVVPAHKHEWSAAPDTAAAAPAPIGTRALHHLAAEPVAASIYARADLAPGARVAGPAIVQEPLSTILVLPGQAATAGRFGELVIERVA